MSADARELDRRLRAAGDLKGVVRTLKSLAAADLRPLQDSVQALEEYTRVLRLGAAVCLRSDSLAGAGGDGLAAPTRGADLILALGSDLGMVGAFNEAVAARLRELRGDAAAEGESVIWTAGDRLAVALEEMDLRPDDARDLPDGLESVGGWVERLVIDLEAMREARGLRSLRIVRNAWEPGRGLAVVTGELLPLERHWARESLPEWPSRRIPEALPAPAPLLSDLAREELFTALFLACTGSMACEALGRMEAMERAERNLDDLQERLGTERNLSRQEAISQELLDLITAYEAVRERRMPGCAP